MKKKIILGLVLISTGILSVTSPIKATTWSSTSGNNRLSLTIVNTYFSGNTNGDNLVRLSGVVNTRDGYYKSTDALSQRGYYTYYPNTLLSDGVSWRSGVGEGVTPSNATFLRATILP